MTGVNAAGMRAHGEAAAVLLLGQARRDRELRSAEVAGSTGAMPPSWHKIA